MGNQKSWFYSQKVKTSGCLGLLLLDFSILWLIQLNQELIEDSSTKNSSCVMHDM